MPAGRPETRASGYCTSPGRQAPQEQPAGLRAQARARPLAPSAWQAMLRDAAPARAGAAGGAGGARAAQPPEAEAHAAGAAPPRPVVLDVRNAYEWDAGHFAGSERPLEVRPPRGHSASVLGMAVSRFASAHACSSGVSARGRTFTQRVARAATS